MKKQLITMGAVGLAMAGMNSGACADEVQAHPAATPNAVQTEAKTPQQQADAAREELERAGDEQAASRQNVAERQEEVQRKQDEYNQAVSGQEQAQKNADAKFQDLNEARKKKDEATQPKLDKAEEDADRARQEQLAAERVLEQAEEQQKKTQEAEDAARNDVNDVRKKVDAAAEDVNRARDIYDNRNEAKAERELEDARTELDSRKDDLSRSEQDLEQNHAAQEKMEQEFRELVKKDNAAHKVTDHWEYRLKSPSVNTDDRMKQLSADFIGVVRDYLAGKADEKTYRDACSAYEQSIYYGVELNGYTVTRRNDAGIPNEWSIKLDTDKTENDEAVDVNNLTQAQIENITNYVAYLINSVRDQLGFTPLTGHVTTSSGAQKLAEDVAAVKRGKEVGSTVTAGEASAIARRYGLSEISLLRSGFYGKHSTNMTELKHWLLEGILNDLFTYTRNPGDADSIWQILGISQLNKAHSKIDETYLGLSTSFVRDPKSAYDDCGGESYAFCFIPLVGGHAVSEADHAAFERSGFAQKLFDPFNREYVQGNYIEAKKESDQTAAELKKLAERKRDMYFWGSHIEYVIQTCRENVAKAQRKVDEARRNLELYRADAAEKLANLNSARAELEKAQNRLAASLEAYNRTKAVNEQAKKAVSDAQKALDAAKRNAKAAENEISELKNAGKEYQKALAAFEKAQAELEAAEKNTSARRQAQRDAQAALEAAKKALAAADAKVREKQQAYDAALLALEVRRQQNLLAQKNQSHVDTTPLVLKAKKIPGVQTEQGKEALPQMGDAAGKSAAVSSAGAVLTAFAGIMAMFGLTERRKRGN